MKLLRTLLIALALGSVCWGWNCPAGQIRQQAPAGTSTSTPYYDVVEGIAFICVPTPVTPVTPTTSGAVKSVNKNLNNNTNTNTNANTNNNNLNQTQQQKQQQQQAQNQNQNATATSNATGGNSTATGGNAVGNGNNSNDTVTNIAAPKIPVNSAITPPIMPTVPCFKGFGGAVQSGMLGGSFGGGKVDPGCDARELARSFTGPQTVASCKILIATKKAKAAGVTMEDCLQNAITVQVQPIPDVHDMARFPEPVQMPDVPLSLSPSLDVYWVTAFVPKPVKHKRMQPACQNGMELRCVLKGEK